MINNIEENIRTVEAEDERQFMVKQDLEVYEKIGAPVGATTLHYHNFYEIIYILEGEFCSMVENETFYLKKGDFLMIPQNTLHKYNYIEGRHDNSKRIILWISDELLLELSDEKIDYTKVMGKKAKAYHFPMYYDELLRSYMYRLALCETPDSDFYPVKEKTDRAYLVLLFSNLLVLCSDEKYCQNTVHRDFNTLVDVINTYIENNLHKNITVDELAQCVHMSKYHFIRQFKKYTGVTVHSFINQKRIIKACELIKAGESIYKAYEETGFLDYSAFLRNFRKIYGVAPSKYREYY